MKLSQPITIRTMTLKNRIMFPPLTTGYENAGVITDKDIAFYSRLAKGDVAYIVIGDVAPISSFSPTPKLHEDKYIEDFKRLADSVHAYGAKLGAQIFHPEYDCDAMNRLAAEKKFDQIRAQMHHDMLHFTDEVSEETLLSIIDKMCACAVRAEKAGLDVIQIHGDRLTGTLCSSLMNHRTDRFGGSLENRTRFAIMLVSAVRQAVPNMIIDYKLSVTTPVRGKGGVSHEEAVPFACMLEKAGVDMLHVAQANHTGNLADTIPPMGIQPYGFFTELAGRVKEAVSIPVSCVGRILTPDMAEQILNKETADIVALGRPLLADPDWAQKAISGHSCDIRQCISCNKGCTDRIQSRQFLSCILNAENGYEGERFITPAKQARQVAVVGAGPAGMEAARVAALKGHKVTLFEKETRLGGQLNIASIPPRKDEMRRAIHNLIHEVRQAGVTLCLGEAVTQEKLLSLQPDAVIIATGAQNFIPPIQGAELPHVCDAWKVLDGRSFVYGKVCVIGGGMVGCETAEYLAMEGADVSIVEMLDTIAQGESTTVLPAMKESWKQMNVKEYPGHKVAEITCSEVVCTGADGGRVSIPCDFVVMAAGAKPVAFDTGLLEEKGIALYRIGDCKDKAADISNAIRTGYDTANSIL